jgi:PAS domain S-box-containing protein
MRTIVGNPRFKTFQRVAVVLGPPVLVVAFALVLFAVLRDVSRQNEWVAHSQDVLATLTATREQVLEAETAKRGYLLTGEERFLTLLEAANAALAGTLARLVALEADHPGNAARAREVAALVDVRQQRAQELLALHGAADADATAPQLQASERSMAVLQEATREYRVAERAALAERQAAAGQRIRWMMLGVLLAGAVAGMLALMTNLLIAGQLAELRDTRRNLRLALDSAGLGMWELDIAPQRTYWDVRTRNVLGRPGEGAVTHEEAVSAIHPDDVDASLARFREVLAPGSTSNYAMEKRIVRPDGVIRWTTWTGVLVRDASGTPLRLVGTLKDVTDVHEARERLRESEERFRLMAEAMPQIVWTAKPDGTVDFYNERWLEFTGASREDGYGAGWRIIVHPEHSEVTAQAWQHAVETGEPYEIEHLIRRQDGEFRWLLSRAVPLLDGEGDIQRWFGTATDIHEQKLAESQLRAARDAAEVASQAKTQFLAVISHELRTPLTGVIGFADLLESGVLGSLAERQKQAVQRITASSWGLVQIIDQILIYSRTEVGREQVHAQVLDLVDLVTEVSTLLEPEATRCGLDLVVSSCQPAIPLHSDAGKVRQILINIVGNAVKFTDSGTVQVYVRAERDGVTEVSVRDTGPGIYAEQLEYIFEPFTQGDQSNTREKGGTGLGLSVSRRLARLLGGDVTVESTPGEGSTFTLRLPHLSMERLEHPGQDSSGRPKPAAPRLKNAASGT